MGGHERGEEDEGPPGPSILNPCGLAQVWLPALPRIETKSPRNAETNVYRAPCQPFYKYLEGSQVRA